MKQIVQDLNGGQTYVADVPAPRARAGHLLIRTRATQVSAGTERMLVEFGKGGLIDKARQQPDKVRQVIDKARTDGLLPTLAAVRNKLDQPLPMGYCNVGDVIEVGAGVTEFAVGDRVASNGKHAEVVCVPRNLCARVPEHVSDEAASFTVLGAIALQGIPLAQPVLGESVAVIGLGLIGLITVQLLRAQGCRVLGIDLDAAKLALARSMGAETANPSAGEDPVRAARAFSRGHGIDAVLICAATACDEPVHQAAQMSRKRGRIVLVGVVGLQLSRADFFEKELSFQVSCSYGPGRYDPNYEERGQDYPVGFVRWTEQRNFEAVLDAMDAGRLDVARLITHRFALADAEQAYALVSNPGDSLGFVLRYLDEAAQSANALLNPIMALASSVAPVVAATSARGPVIGWLGSGNYSGAVLMPAFHGTGVRCKTVVSHSGVSGAHQGKKFAFERAASDAQIVMGDPEVSAVVIATRHDSHARYVCQALRAGKDVFVEKPLALTEAELSEIEQAMSAAQATATASESVARLMVGFNRRFAPHVERLRSLLQSVREPRTFIMTVNAGAVPAEHWTQDVAAGGGRIIGEACHFIDLIRHSAGQPIVASSIRCASRGVGTRGPADNATISLEFSDGSTGTIHYLANGNKSFPKERLEVFCAGRVLTLDSFRSLRGYGWPGLRTVRLWRQDKGQRACAAAFVTALRERRTAPIPFTELIDVAQVTIDMANRLA